MEKIVLFFVAIIITLILGVCIFFAIYILVMIYSDFNDPKPEEHPIMPAGAVVFAFITTIPISLFILYKTYILLVKKILQ
jgi:hypothetical protein